MGRFELLFGEERDGSPGYQQAHSIEMPDIVRVLLLMSGDNWLLGQDSIGEGIALISSVEHDPLLSPTTGWFFYNERGDCIEDPSLTLPSTSPTRFELLVGEETDGSPVYQQAHSREMPQQNKVLLFRWENSNNFFFILYQVWRRVAG